VKNPGADDRALTSDPKGGGLPLGNLWNDGMVEKWNIGYEKRMMS